MSEKFTRAFVELKKCLTDVGNRRRKWDDASRIIDQAMAAFAEKWKSAGGDDHYVDRRTNQLASFGIRTINCNCVSMHSGNRPVGIGERTESSAKNVLETSGSLEFCQSPDGHIIVIASPPTSSVKKAPFDRLILHYRLDPSSITYELVDAAIEDYLWLQRICGFGGLPSFWDRMSLFRYWALQWRHSTDPKEWAAFWAAVIALLVAVVSMATDLIGLFSKSP